MDLPKKIIQVLRQFEEVFSERVWQWAKVLLIGAILAPGERTVTAILRVMGQSQERQFQNYTVCSIEPSGLHEHSAASYCIWW
jgi:hypothetical protein